MEPDKIYAERKRIYGVHTEKIYPADIKGICSCGKSLAAAGISFICHRRRDGENEQKSKNGGGGLFI